MNGFDFEQLSISERKIIVGIDFGTTYSGVAWAETHRPDRRSAITSWPISRTTREGESSEKVPTKLRYTPDGIEWGFSIPLTAPADEIIEWFKLDLDPSLKDMSLGIKSAVARGDHTVDQLLTDYISALTGHLMYTLREKLGAGVVKSIPLEYVVTVPAIWSDMAKDQTKRACQRAKTITSAQVPIHLVSEPEAAAIYALHGLDPHGLSIGDSFVICDAGGGTVDLISYTITKLKPILEVQEAAPGTGALCGSTFLNVRFGRFLEAKLGKLPGFDDEVLAEAMDKFEKAIKRQFTANAPPDQTFTVPVGGLANDKKLGISRGRYSLKVTDLHAIFEPVVQEVVKLVNGQITASQVPIKAVLLVGGFGASNYLKERLRAAVGVGIRVMQPSNAWLAVVHGAVMKGLAQSAPDDQLTQVKVTNRRARKHLGMEWGVEFDVDKHRDLRHKRYWSSFSGYWRVSVMEWFIKQGDSVAENEPFYTEFNLTVPVAQGRLKKLSTTVYADRLSTVAPLARNGNSVELCRVEADITHIPETELTKRKGKDDQMYYDISCKIESIYLSASTQYTLIYKGQRYNSVTAEYV